MRSGRLRIRIECFMIMNSDMKKQLESVELFHNVFGHAVANSPTADVDFNLRHALMAEENDEYHEAAESGDIVGVADALGDQLYILCGTILQHGLQHVIEEVFDEIQKSNMSKLDANGKPIYRADGKILKGENYFKPDIKKYLK